MTMLFRVLLCVLLALGCWVFGYTLATRYTDRCVPLPLNPDDIISVKGVYL